jgi:hypothetical protein
VGFRSKCTKPIVFTFVLLLATAFWWVGMHKGGSLHFRMDGIPWKCRDGVDIELSKYASEL